MLLLQLNIFLILSLGAAVSMVACVTRAAADKSREVCEEECSKQQPTTTHRDESTEWGISVSEEHCADTTVAKRKRGKYFVPSRTGFCGNANVTLRGEPSASLALNRFPGRWGGRGGAVKVSWLSPVHSWTCADQLTHCCCHCCRIFSLLNPSTWNASGVSVMKITVTYVYNHLTVISAFSLKISPIISPLNALNNT